MPLSWNEIKSKALGFSKTWADAASEDSQAKPFWIDFFEIFGISDKRVATFEHAVKKLPGANARTDGFVDLFWPGMLLVEHKKPPSFSEGLYKYHLHDKIKIMAGAAVGQVQRPKQTKSAIFKFAK